MLHIYPLQRGDVVWVLGSTSARLGLVLRTDIQYLKVRVPDVGVLKIKRNKVRPVKWIRIPCKLWNILMSPIGKK